VTIVVLRPIRRRSSQLSAGKPPSFSGQGASRTATLSPRSTPALTRWQGLSIGATRGAIRTIRTPEPPEEPATAPLSAAARSCGRRATSGHRATEARPRIERSRELSAIPPPTSLPRKKAGRPRVADTHSCPTYRRQEDFGTVRDAARSCGEFADARRSRDRSGRARAPLSLRGTRLLWEATISCRTRTMEATPDLGGSRAPAIGLLATTLWRATNRVRVTSLVSHVFASRPSSGGPRP